MPMKTSLACAAIASMLLTAPVLAVEALAVDGNNTITFAQFTQVSTSKIAKYGAPGGGNTLTIAESPAYFVVQAFGPIGFYATTLSMSAFSNNLVTSLGLQFEQKGWNGSMTFGDGANFLTVDFTNATFSFDGSGGSASLISTDPVNPITFTSNLLTLPVFDHKNFSLAFSGLSPTYTVLANGYGKAFNANIAGTFAGSTPIPEPATWAMMLAGFGMIGATARRRTGIKSVTA
jgi:hypothetical protein